MDMFSGVKKNIIQFYFLKIKPNIKPSLKIKGCYWPKNNDSFTICGGGKSFLF